MKSVTVYDCNDCRQYRKTAHYNVTHRRRQNFYALPTAEWQMLAAPPFNILDILDRVDDAIDANASIASDILSTGLTAFGVEPEPESRSGVWRQKATPSDMDKARSTIRQLYRDWSAEGSDERRLTYEPVLDDLSSCFEGTGDKSRIKVLVPGAGLGRLMFEICKLGYDVEGNEISYHQLLTSNWVLNQLKEGEQRELYPFALTFSNHLSRENQLKKVKVPDVHPGTELERASVGGTNVHAFQRMNMTAADFVVLYGDDVHKDTFHAVATVFFLDTAPNVVRYVEVIHRCLREGGLWINLGPLLWHFEEKGPSDGKNDRKYQQGIAEPGSIELTLNEVMLLVQSKGFHIERQEIKNEGVGYIQDPASMMQNLYQVSHWVARKM
ncbi:hypothetical protein MMC09_001020 [Bachmanniomyces sp. S44760]|nr:hypothetical protein [Bachmanniomyces sp. S44760]